MNISKFSFPAGALVCASLLTAPAQAITPYSQDFEDLDQDDIGALAADEWLVGANVFAPDGTTFLYFYFSFPAPNNPEEAAFSLIADGQGGPEQGAQQLVVFSDYLNADHGNGTGNRIESNVFQEQIIGAGDLGRTLRFLYDAKLGDLAGATTALAFIKVLDLVGGTFAPLGIASQDMTTTPVEWTGYVLDLTIDASWEGQLLQFGFINVASDFEPSGVFYDNVRLFDAGDVDGDGVDNDTDNCTFVANPDQADANGDLIGNLCDPDVTGPGDIEDCTVNFLDLNAFKAGFFGFDPELNLDGVGNVSFADLNIVKDAFFGPPGPSAAGCN